MGPQSQKQSHSVYRVCTAHCQNGPPVLAGPPHPLMLKKKRCLVFPLVQFSGRRARSCLSMGMRSATLMPPPRSCGLPAAGAAIGSGKIYFPPLVFFKLFELGACKALSCGKSSTVRLLLNRNSTSHRLHRPEAYPRWLNRMQ